jgi:RNA polymerase sigma-70 factor (ECF subfamily)
MSDRDTRFADFVNLRSAALLRTAYLLTGDQGRAEDLLQTAFTKTYLAWDRIRDQNAVEAYARRVLATTATSWWRRKWHGEHPTETLPELAVVDQAELFDERDRIWSLILALPAKQRAVLVLRFYEDLSEAQIAETLGLSTGTVKSHCSRALSTLRRQLSAEDPGATESASVLVSALGGSHA